MEGTYEYKITSVQQASYAENSMLPVNNERASICCLESERYLNLKSLSRVRHSDCYKSDNNRSAC